jgi:hypothetical protein
MTAKTSMNIFLKFHLLESMRQFHRNFTWLNFSFFVSIDYCYIFISLRSEYLVSFSSLNLHVV